MNDKDAATPRARTIGVAAAGTLVVLATGVAMAAGSSLAAPDVVMLYLVAIMFVAVRWGYVPALVASSLSVLAYDFFFVPPLFTFAVSDQRNLITFAVLFAVGLTLSALTRRIRQQEHDARARERRTSALYGLSRALGSAASEPDVVDAALRHLAATFEGAPTLFFADGDALSPAREREIDANDLRAARYALEHGRPAGRGTARVPSAAMTCVRIGSEKHALGVVGIRAATTPDRDEIALLDGFAQQLAFALDRLRATDRAEAATMRARTEELRNALLSAVSHDLRTPLAVITGAATTLRDAAIDTPHAERADLVATICEEADHLERLVANLLDMTRVEAGALDVKREWVPLEEIVGSAIARLDEALRGHPLTIDLGPDAPLVSADPILLGQVLVNLFENAAKHTLAGAAIDVHARVVSDVVTVDVADRGPGLPAGDPTHLFDKWTRGAGTRTSGAGLGLAICRGILEAHGGAIEALPRPGGGAIFRFTIRGAPAPTLPADVPSHDARPALV